MANHTEVITVKLWDFIEGHPGLTRDELVVGALADGIVTPNANRMYAADLNKHRGRPPAGRSAGGRRAEPWTVDSAKANRFVIVRALDKMRQSGSIRRDEEGRYFVARPLRRRGIGALVVSSDDVRADAALRHLRITAHRYRDKLERPNVYFPEALQRALRVWLELDRSEYSAAQATREAAAQARRNGELGVATAQANGEGEQLVEVGRRQLQDDPAQPPRRL